MGRNEDEFFSAAISPQQFRGGRPARPYDAPAPDPQPPADDRSWQRLVEAAHAYHHARRGPQEAPPVDRETNAAQVRSAARRRAAETGQPIAQVLAEAGFHPVTGMSMRPVPSTPQYETDPSRLFVPVGQRAREERSRNVRPR